MYVNIKLKTFLLQKLSKITEYYQCIVKCKWKEGSYWLWECLGRWHYEVVTFFLETSSVICQFSLKITITAAILLGLKCSETRVRVWGKLCLRTRENEDWESVKSVSSQEINIPKHVLLQEGPILLGSHKMVLRKRTHFFCRGIYLA